MPELPEVETVRRGLERFAVGRRVTGVEVGRERTVRRTSREAVIHGLTDTTILAANRRGKYLLLPLDTGDEVMIHLRMSGQVLVAPAGTMRPPHTHVVLHLDDGHELWFVDPRTFGEVVVFDPTNAAVEVPDVANLGPDPIAEVITLRQFRWMLRSRRRLLKPLLLDQHVIAGIGNIYADEILHAARLRPDRHSDELSLASERRLHESIHEILSSAIEAGGSTLRDAQYVDLFGEGGSYQDAHSVYGRTGERCRTCGVGWIRRTVSAQRSTHFCPRCQR
ncbi:MAG TPA: bifunctional DNA-formamidopyrimidine glycosylase/DNA-(apurinic or apyrimidinic site) lyase [Ilumatobacter sp.]|nr:bifunctional DNA-formamidopyrimidine glycosylase/DNA-(apurinic or apyrimidinic site) lyase [Ilumatobacter sp.]